MNQNSSRLLALTQGIPQLRKAIFSENVLMNQLSSELPVTREVKATNFRE
jgi:hypothetical protein